MRPTVNAVMLFVGGVGIALLPTLVNGRLWGVWLVCLGASVLVLGLDIVHGLPKRRLRVQSQAPSTVYIGDQGHLSLTLEALNWERPLEVELLVDLDPQLERQPPQRVTLLPNSQVQAQVLLRPARRGKFTIHAVWLRWTGPYGMIRRELRILVDLHVAVVPNLRSVRSAALRFFSRDALFGQKAQRTHGDGSEFEALREYVPGLDHRAIDWKHSARHHKLVCKEFRAERNHPVIIAFDTGHLMSEPMAGIPKLDHAINAGLVLAYYGLRSGDRIGLFAFDARVRLYTPPSPGSRSFPRFQGSSAELQYHAEETNFTLGLAELSARLQRRSLIILLTDFVDTITAELMVENIQRLSRRHLIVFVTLRDPGLTEISHRVPETFTDVARSVVAEDFRRERQVVLERLRHLGVQCLDVAPAQISVQLLNRYLDIKQRELV